MPTLPFTDGERAVYGFYAEVHTLTDWRTGKGVDVRVFYGKELVRLKTGKPVYRPAQRVNDSSLQEITHRYSQLLSGITDKVPCRKPCHIVVGHKQDSVILESNDLRQRLPAGILTVNMADVADSSFSAGSLYGHSYDILYFADVADGFGVVNHIRHIPEHKEPPMLRPENPGGAASKPPQAL